MRKAIFFFVFLLFAFSAVGEDSILVTKNHFPTISVVYEAKEGEGVSILNRTLFLIDKNKEYLLTDSPQNPQLSIDATGQLTTYTFLFTPQLPLKNGQYIFSITAQDSVNNSVMKTKSFDVSIPFADLTLLNPKYNVSTTKVFDLVIQSSEKLQGCRYANYPIDYEEIFSQKNWFLTSDGYNFTIKDFELGMEDDPLNIYVMCKDYENFSNDGNLFTLLYDNSNPLINAYSSPLKVIDSLNVNLVAESMPFSNNQLEKDKKDLINCRFSTDSTKGYESMEFAFSDSGAFNDKNILTLTDKTTPSISDQKDYTFYVLCKNRAGLLSDKKTISFSVNLAEGSFITDFGPSGYVKTRNVTLNVNTNRKSDCFYTDGQSQVPFSGQGTINHIKSLSLDDGDYTYNVECRNFFPTGLPQHATISFKVDTTSPQQPTVLIAPSCYDDQITANISSGDDEDVSYYRYRLTTETKNLTNYKNINARNNKVTLTINGLNLDIGITYSLNVIAYDSAGNPSQETNVLTTILDASLDTTCENLIGVNETNIGSNVSEDNTTDSDGDGLPDWWETKYFGRPICDDAGICGPDADPDNDGLTNLEEFNGGTDPNVADSSGSSNTDNTTDSDGDGLPDWWETKYFGSPICDDAGVCGPDADPDNDGLTNLEEFNGGTDPRNPDNINTTDSTANQTDSDNNGSQTNENNGILWIILLILGLLMILSGGGYLLYKKYIGKNEGINETEQSFSFSGQDKNNTILHRNILRKDAGLEGRIPFSNDEQKAEFVKRRILLQNELLKKRREGKTNERKGILSSFSSEEAQEPAIKTENASKAPVANKSEESRKIMLDMIKKQEGTKQEKTSKKDQQNMGIKKDETSDRLDSLVKKESVFESLEKLSSKDQTPLHIKEKLNALSQQEESSEDKLDAIGKKGHGSIDDIDKIIEKNSSKKSLFEDLSKERIPAQVYQKISKPRKRKK